jgi:hypothetical protein
MKYGAGGNIAEHTRNRPRIAGRNA